MTVLLTGGGGFIGSALATVLQSQGRALRFLALSQGQDFREPSTYAELLQGVDVLVHLAWTSVPAEASAQPIRDIEDNLQGSLRLLQAAMAAGVGRFVFVSTGGAVYGLPQYLPVDEAHPTRPYSPYGISKLAFEHYLAFYRQTQGLDYRIFRVANAYGPGQNLAKNQGDIGHWLKAAAEGRPLQLWGSPDIVRDYLFIDDLAEALALGLAYEGEERLFNLGAGRGYSLAEILQALQAVLPLMPPVEYRPGRGYDVPVNILDSSRLQKALNWQAKTELKEGLQKTWNWLKTR